MIVSHGISIAHGIGNVSLCFTQNLQLINMKIFFQAYSSVSHWPTHGVFIYHLYTLVGYQHSNTDTLSG